MGARILIIEDDLLMQKLHRKVLEQGGYEVVIAADGLEGTKLAREQPFDLIVSDVMMPNMDGYEATRTLRADPKTAHIPILLLTSLDDLESKIKGFEAGADDYLAKPYEAEELLARVSVLLRRAAAAAAPRETLAEVGKTIAIFSLRGGVGVSSIAANLAAGLSQLWGKECALVDMVLSAGQAALMLNLPLRTTWTELAKIPTEEIEHDVVSMTMRQHPSGVHVLSAPRRVEEGELVTGETVTRVLELVRQMYHYTVLDLPHNFSETTLAALDMADAILVVLTPELAAVRSTALALEVFDTLGYSRETTYLILNWVFESQGLDRADIEAGLGRKISLVIPHAGDRLVRAINIGQPPVLEAPESPLGVLFETLAFSVSREEDRTQRPAEPTEAWKRLARRMRKKKTGR
ncbi:MAG: response regulator [Anaerolineae bacterium]|nr:MAG: response regulator [Anaerolineae bacterium]